MHSKQRLQVEWLMRIAPGARESARLGQVIKHAPHPEQAWGENQSRWDSLARVVIAR